MKKDDGTIEIGNVHGATEILVLGEMAIILEDNPISHQIVDEYNAIVEEEGEEGMKNGDIRYILVEDDTFNKTLYIAKSLNAKFYLFHNEDDSIRIRTIIPIEKGLVKSAFLRYVMMNHYDIPEDEVKRMARFCVPRYVRKHKEHDLVFDFDTNGNSQFFKAMNELGEAIYRIFK